MASKNKKEKKAIKDTRTVFITRVEVHHPDTLEQAGEDLARMKASPTVFEGEGSFTTYDERGSLSVEDGDGRIVARYANGAWTKVLITYREEEQPLTPYSALSDEADE